ncbi:MAG: ATP-grasp domain-containing protein [Alkalispirochaeta sp.]
MSEHGDSILILGGGVMQIPAIAAARRLGLWTHVADGNARCPGSAEADVFHHIDLRDLEGLLACAREIPGLKGAFTAGTDFSSSVAWITEHLGLPGISYEVSLAATDKGRMRDRLSSAGVGIPVYRIISESQTSPSEIRTIAHDLRFPVVCKPADNMGARGVRRVTHLDDLPGAVFEAIRLSVSGRVIVEELIAGQEYSLDALVVDGSVHITGIAQRHVYFPPWFVELGHTIPASLRNRDLRALESTFADAIRAIGIDRGAAKGDIFLTHSSETGEPEITVGEIAARLSGGYMSGWTYPASSGVPLTKIGIEIALGRPVTADHLIPTRHRVCVERAVISAPGVVDTIETPVPASEGGILTAEEHVFVTCSEGDSVSVPTNNVEKVANIIAVGGSVKEAEDRVAEIRRHIHIGLVPHNLETDRYVFEEGWSGPWAHYALPKEDRFDLDQRPMVQGRIDQLEDIVTRGQPLPVQPLVTGNPRWTDHIEARHIAVDGVESLHGLVKNGVVVFALESSRADGIFWKAFLSSGLQGVKYLISCLATSREVTA